LFFLLKPALVDLDRGERDLFVSDGICAVQSEKPVGASMRAERRQRDFDGRRSESEGFGVGAKELPDGEEGVDELAATPGEVVIRQAITNGGGGGGGG